MARTFPWLLVATTLWACSPEPPQQTFTTDIRLDGADIANDPDSSGTKMCLTDDGVIYVLWVDDRLNPDTGRNDIWLNRSVSVGVWEEESWFSSPVKVNQGVEGEQISVWNPSLFCNELGVFVVWEDDRDGELDNHQIYFNRSTDQGETFLPEDVLLEVDPDGMSMSLEPRITGYGQDLYVVWYDNLNGAYDILVASSSDAGNIWRSPVRVDSDEPAGSAYSARPRMAVSNNGQDVWVVWEDSRDGAADIYFAHSETGATTFQEDERLDTGDDDGQFDSFEPQICTDGLGSVYAVWHDARNSEANRDIYFNYTPDGGNNWLGAAQRLEGNKNTGDGDVLVDNPGFGNSLFPVCVSEGNVGHMTWYDQVTEDQGYDIYYARVEGGVVSTDAMRLDLGSEEQIEPAGYANSVDPRVAIDGTTVVVGWSDGRGEATAAAPSGYDDLYYNYSQGGEPFQEQDFRIDSMYSGASFKDDVNVDVLGGILVAAWTDGRGGTSDVYFTPMALGEEAEPPVLTEDAGAGATTPAP